MGAAETSGRSVATRLEEKTAEVYSNTSARVGEVDFLQLILHLWTHKAWIIACTSAATALGIAYAFLATPSYSSQATIAMKESGKGGDASRLFSQLGGMGGMVASQLGFGSTNLDKIEILLKGHELAETVIGKNNLLPVIFHEKWNGLDSAWNTEDPAEIPTVRDGTKTLRKDLLSVTLDAKKNVIKVGVSLYDSVMAKRIVDFYLVELNDKIRRDVIKDAEMNRDYLERQLNNTSDPTLREKILGMIGFEVEKSMLVSSQAFDVLEKAIVPSERSKPKRKIVVTLSLILGLTASMTGVLATRGISSLKAASSRPG